MRRGVRQTCTDDDGGCRGTGRAAPEGYDDCGRTAGEPRRRALRNPDLDRPVRPRPHRQVLPWACSRAGRRVEDPEAHARGAQIPRDGSGKVENLDNAKAAPSAPAAAGGDGIGAGCSVEVASSTLKSFTATRSPARCAKVGPRARLPLLCESEESRYPTIISIEVPVPRGQSIARTSDRHSFLDVLCGIAEVRPATASSQGSRNDR